MFAARPLCHVPGRVLAARLDLGYTGLIGRAGASFCRVDMRCVFSGNLNVQHAAGVPDTHSALMRLFRPVAALRNDLTTTTFPSDCRLCDGPLTAFARTPVCTACLQLVRPQQEALCEICGEALGMESIRFAAAQGGGTCTTCRLAPPEFSRAVAYAAYDDELRELLHLLKYEGMQYLATAPLGHWLAEPSAMLSKRLARRSASCRPTVPTSTRSRTPSPSLRHCSARLQLAR